MCRQAGPHTSADPRLSEAQNSLLVTESGIVTGFKRVRAGEAENSEEPMRRQTDERGRGAGRRLQSPGLNPLSYRIPVGALLRHRTHTEQDRYDMLLHRFDGRTTSLGPLGKLYALLPFWASENW